MVEWKAIFRSKERSERGSMNSNIFTQHFQMVSKVVDNNVEKPAKYRERGSRTLHSSQLEKWADKLQLLKMQITHDDF